MIRSVNQILTLHPTCPRMMLEARNLDLTPFGGATDRDLYEYPILQLMDHFGFGSIADNHRREVLRLPDFSERSNGQFVRFRLRIAGLLPLLLGDEVVPLGPAHSWWLDDARDLYMLAARFQDAHDGAVRQTARGLAVGRISQDDG